jgi:hypothetical protein
MDDYRESIWGISPKDRGWFQLLTLMGGTAGSIMLTVLELGPPSSATPPNEVARNVALGIGASFVASGFIAWGLLQAKELMMSIGDWFREANARREQRRRERDYMRGYEKGYEDAQKGSPPRPPGTPENGNQPGTGREENGDREDQ